MEENKVKVTNGVELGFDFCVGVSMFFGAVFLFVLCIKWLFA